MTAAFEPARYPETARVLKYTDGRLVTIEEAEPIYKKYGYSVFFTTGKAKASNGHADGIAIAKDLTLEITRIHPPLSWSELRLKNPVLQKLPAVYTPGGYVDIFYRCEASGALEFIACDPEGFALIETVSWSIVAPTPGYLIEGTMRDPLMLSTGQRDAVRALFAQFDERPKVADVVQRLIPAVKDIMPAPETGFPPISDEDRALIDHRIGPTKLIPAEFAADSMTLTQDNVAKYFEQVFADEFKYCKTWGQWFEWARYWKPENTDLPFDKCRNMIRRLNREMNKQVGTSSFASGVERLARASRQFASTSDQWDANEWLLNMPDGTLNMQTGEAYSHRRDDYITKITRVSPSTAPKPIFERFLRDITLEDSALANYLQRSLGSCLSGAIQDHWILVWIGEGRNGKNTLGDLVTWIMGDYATVIPTQTLMSQKYAPHLTEIANLRGLRLAVSSEVSEGSYWDEARVKLLTGEQRLSARYMHKDLFTFRRTHKHLVYGNHRPMLRVVDVAMRSRLHLVPFKARFTGEVCDPLMPDKLKTEAPQVLQWLIDGHSQWLEQGGLLKCSAVEKETDEYFEAQSTNEAWVEECCRLASEYRSSAKDLYQSFKAYKESRGEGVLSQNRWGEWMSQRYDKYKSHGTVWYRGIEVKPQSVLDFQA